MARKECFYGNAETKWDARKIKRIAGTWVGEERIHPSPWDPKGGIAIGRVQNRLALDSFAVVQDYEQERNGEVNFRGHGVFTWNQSERCYALYWFDSMGFPPNVFKENFENDVLTLSTKDLKGHSRAIFDFSSDGSYKYRMDVSQDANQWYTFMEGTYERKD